MSANKCRYCGSTRAVLVTVLRYIGGNPCPHRFVRCDNERRCERRRIQHAVDDMATVAVRTAGGERLYVDLDRVLAAVRGGRR